MWGLSALRSSSAAFPTSPNDVDAARAAGSPTELTITFRVIAAIFGIGFAALAGAELVTRFRKAT